MRGTPQYFIFTDAARSGYPGIIYVVSSPAATNYRRASGDNASRIFRTLREMLQDTVDVPFPSSSLAVTIP